jgi:hypothetical protein
MPWDNRHREIYDHLLDFTSPQDCPRERRLAGYFTDSVHGDAGVADHGVEGVTNLGVRRKNHRRIHPGTGRPTRTNGWWI